MFALAVLTGALFAQTATAPKPPVIPDAIQKEIARLQRRAMELRMEQMQLQQMNEQFNKDSAALNDKVVAVCGKDFRPGSLKDSEDTVCVPATAPAQEKKK